MGTTRRRLRPFFEQALTHAPQDVPSLVWLAEMNLAQNRYDAAEDPLEKAQALDPSNGAVLYGLGRVALEKQDYAQAAKYLEAALAIRPDANRLHYPLALAYRGLGNRDKAEEHVRLRGEVELPPVDPLLGEVSGLLQNAAAFEARGSQALGARQWAEAVTNLTEGGGTGARQRVQPTEPRHGAVHARSCGWRTRAVSRSGPAVAHDWRGRTLPSAC